jgi:DNA recombination protein RmuC
LQLALEHDPRIQEWAYEQGVVIATPTILVALLRTVAHAWKEDTLAKNARDVLVTGKELYERLTKMGDHLARVGKAIDSAGKAYNDTIGALERRVLPSARRFGQLQEIEAEFAPTMIATEVREIAAAELISGTDD